MYETKKKTHLRDFLHEICFGPVVICVLPLPLLQQKQHKKFLKLRHNLITLQIGPVVNFSNHLNVNTQTSNLYSCGFFLFLGGFV